MDLFGSNANIILMLARTPISSQTIIRMRNQITEELLDQSSIQNDQATDGGFQTLDEFQRRYFPNDFQVHATVDSSEAVLNQITEESADMIKAAFADSR